MQIRHRIQIIVLTAIVALCAIGAYAIHQSRKNTDRVRVVTDDIVPSAIASSDLVSDLKDVQLATVNLILANDDALANQIKETLDTQKAKLKSAIDLQAQHADSKTQQGLVEQAKESLENYISAVDDTVALRLNGQTEIASSFAVSAS